MTTNHTPTPWPDPTFHCAPYTIWKENTLIATCRCTDDEGRTLSEFVQDDFVAKANAAYIVKCVNAHDGLVGALGQCVRIFDMALPKFNWGDAFLDARAIRLLNEVTDIARDVLAKVKS